LPSLTALARALSKQGIVVLAVGADEDAGKYRRFLQDHQVALETCRDPSRRVAKSFGTVLFPETYVIRNGRIVRKVVGAIDWVDPAMTSFLSRLAQ
jgi:peroxiredoxin